MKTSEVWGKIGTGGRERLWAQPFGLDSPANWNAGEDMAAYFLNPNQRAVYRRYAGLPLPRHTSYPMAPVWQPEYNSEQFRADLADMPASIPLSLYVHVPFCRKLCYYCACTKQTQTGICLTAPLGRLLVRVVAAVFDRYLPAHAFREGLPTQLSSRVG